MELAIVCLVVAAAALYAGRGLYLRRGKGDGDGCSGNCSTCPFAAGCVTGQTRAAGSGAPDWKKNADGVNERWLELKARARREPPAPGAGGAGKGLKVLGVLAVAAALPDAARAADTIETWDPGAWDAEAYVGVDGLGASRADRALVGDAVLGYGVAPRLSAYLAGTLETGADLGDGQPELRLGVFGTPLDLEHFDLDLLFEVAAIGRGLSRLEAVPGIEANLDLESPLGPWGVYLRAAVPFGREEHVRPDGMVIHRTGHSFDYNPGIYWTVREGHQLLAEYDVAWVPGPGETPGAWENGGAALGYNVKLSDAFELITQATVAPTGSRWVPGVLAGFIATIPP